MQNKRNNGGAAKSLIKMLEFTIICQQCWEVQNSSCSDSHIVLKNNKKTKKQWISSGLVWWLLRARGARQGPSDTGCPGCWPQPPGCWLCSPRPQTEPDCGGGSWWPWRPFGPATPAAASPCSLVGRPGTEAWTCPPGSSCARRLSRRGAPPSGCRRPAGDTTFKNSWVGFRGLLDVIFINLLWN